MCSGPWSESSKQGWVPEYHKLNSNAQLNWLCSGRATRLSLDSQTSQLHSPKPCRHQTRRWQSCFCRATEDWGLGHPWKRTVLCMYWPIRKALGKLTPAGSHYLWRHCRWPHAPAMCLWLLSQEHPTGGVFPNVVAFTDARALNFDFSSANTSVLWKIKAIHLDVNNTPATPCRPQQLGGFYKSHTHAPHPAHCRSFILITSFS